jgi:hypothetical protein
MVTTAIVISQFSVEKEHFRSHPALYLYRRRSSTDKVWQPASEFDVPDWWIQFNEPTYAEWDGSWSADFPSSAAMAKWYYDSGGNPLSPVDGVIAMDIIGFEYVLSQLSKVLSEQTTFSSELRASGCAKA